MKFFFKVYCLIVFEIVGRISIVSFIVFEVVGRERSGGYMYEMLWDCVLDVYLGREERFLEEEYVIFIYIVYKKLILKLKVVDLDGMILNY